MGLGNQQMIIDFSNGQDIDNVLMFFGTTTTTLNTYVCNYRSCVGTQISSITLGQWTHIAFTFASNKNVVVYFNGEKVKSFSSTKICQNILRTSCKIGRSDWYPGNLDLNAVLDELKIFNRSLGNTEIISEMEQQEPFEKMLFN